MTLTPGEAVSRKQRRMPRRHECEVTADRLGNAVTKYNEKFDGAEKDAIGFIIDALDQIAAGQR